MAQPSIDMKTRPLPPLEPGKPESWVQLLPAGQFDLNDSRGPWIVKDMAAIIGRSHRDLERGMPVDMDHALDRGNGVQAPAAGWIEELAARQDGIWARITWTPTGQARIAGREYRFISPVVMVTKAGEVLAVKRAGLTNDPAITMKALCSVEDDAAAEDAPDDAAAVIAMLREALGVGPEVPVADLIRKARAVLSGAGERVTDPRAARELASSYAILLGELHEGKVEAALERARNDGKLVPVMEGWAKELASSNLPAFEAWAACTPAHVTFGTTLAGRSAPQELLDRGRFRGSDERMAVCSQLGIDPADME